MKVYDKFLYEMDIISKSLATFSIGRSELGQELFAFNLGKKPKILLFGAIHAREYITSFLLTALAQEWFENFSGEGIMFVPMLNPDGVRLSTEGLSFVSPDRGEFLTKVNGGSDFSLWKANINAVDLNVNFDADWGGGKQNVFYPSPANYVGTKPFSERETRAIKQASLDKSLVLCYHSKGEVIYYGFGGDNTDKRYAKKLGKALKYQVETSHGSAGGFKDWFVDNNRGVALTVEVGNDNLKHPIDLDEVPNFVDKHRVVKNVSQEILEQYSARK